MRLAVLLMLCLWAMPAEAQTYDTLEIVRPRAVGVGGSGLDADNRIYRAYQGITYSINATARGGQWPYTYSLSNAPAGMTIEAGPCTDIGLACTAGTITWTNPQATASNITVTITDSLGAQVTGTWSITVSTTIGADGFCFLNSVSGNDTTGTGSLAAPWASIAKAQASCGARSILYFRTGTYVTTGATETDSGELSPGYRHKVAFNEASAPVIWLEYPGDTAVIDYAAVNVNSRVQLFDLTGQNIWLDGFEMKNIQCVGFRLERSDLFGAVVRGVTGRAIVGGYDGGNCSFVLWKAQYAGPFASYHDTVQNSTLYDLNGNDCSFKIYSVREGIWETSYYYDSNTTEGTIALKAEVPDYTVRANKFGSDVLTAIGGNMDDSPSAGLGPTKGHILHNLVLGSGTASAEGTITIGVAKVDHIGETWVYRNTLMGVVNASNVATADGPYHFNDNVIANSGGSGGSCPSRLTCYSVTDYTRIDVNADNLQGANDGSIVNATTGNLVNASYIGTYGYQIAASHSSRATGGLRITGGGRFQ